MSETNNALRRKVIPFLIASLVVLPHCTADEGGGGGGGETWDAGSPEVAANLEQALEIVPADAQEASFTDWTRLKEVSGYTSSDGDPIQKARDMMVQLNEGTSPVFLTYDVAAFPDHEELWGWGFEQLEWEAAFSPPEGGPVHILRFGDDYDVTGISALFEERGYDTAQYEDLTIYTHEIDQDEVWFANEFGPRAPLAVLNATILEEDNMLILSSESAGVEAAIDTLSGAAPGAGDSALGSALSGVAGAPSVYVAPGSVLCGGELTLGPPTAEGSEAAPPAGNAYQAMAMGYAWDHDATLTGRIVFQYEESDAASEDLEVRSEAARGQSLRTLEPYSASVFELEEAHVEETQLILEVRPAESGVIALADAVAALDLAFAAC